MGTLANYHHLYCKATPKQCTLTYTIDLHNRPTQWTYTMDLYTMDLPAQWTYPHNGPTLWTDLPCNLYNGSPIIQWSHASFSTHPCCVHTLQCACSHTFFGLLYDSMWLPYKVVDYSKKGSYLEGNLAPDMHCIALNKRWLHVIKCVWFPVWGSLQFIQDYDLHKLFNQCITFLLLVQ